MVKGTTKSGFAFEYNPLNLDDMRFIDVLATVMDDDASDVSRISASSKLTEMLVGKEQKKRLYDHIGSMYEGRVPSQALSTEIFEMIAANGKDAEKN